jgi:UDP-N-acetylglucosamine diphosphorylase/glucosamine-1-phosphate N-acetyltransferase
MERKIIEPQILGNLQEDLAIVILAAGKGTRMKSDIPKVLHKVAGKSMVVHVIEAVRNLTQNNIFLVVGHQAPLVEAEVSPRFLVNYVKQTSLLGTGDAVKQVLPHLPSKVKQVLVLCGDVPLIQAATLTSVLVTHRTDRAKITVLSVNMQDPSRYGRVVLDASGGVMSIREESDATLQEKQIKIINTGIYCFDRTFLEEAIELIRPDNNQAEFYLTDMVEIARSKREKISVRLMKDSRQVMGVNSPYDLERVESLIQEIENELP